MAQRRLRLPTIAAVVATQVFGLGSLALASPDDPVSSTPPADAAPATESAPAVAPPKAAVARKSTRPRRRKASTFKGYVPAHGRMRRTPAPRPAGELTLYSINTRERLELTSIYDEKG